jgi:putative addiction module killer protein/probable addiction module antidote protein
VIELIRYRQEDGREPYTEWFRDLRDRMAKARIADRLRQIECGNLGDSKAVGEGVTELRIHIGAGYRVYCGRRGAGLGDSSLRWRQRQPDNGHRKSQDALGRLEAEATMKKYSAGVSHDERTIEELREDREYAVAVLQVAMESLENPAERGGGLLALRAVAEAYGGLGAVAEQAGISRESLYRALSPKGNPTLKTLVAVLKTMGLRLSVTEKQPADAGQAKEGGDTVAA